MSEFLTAVIALLIVWIPIGVVGTLAVLLYDWSQEGNYSQGFRAYAEDWLSTQAGYLNAHASHGFAMIYKVVRQASDTFRTLSASVRSICAGGGR